MILLDTHAALWFTLGSDSLGRHSQRIARQALTESQLAVSAVSFWEIALLVVKRRLRTIASTKEIRDLILGTGINGLTLTGDVAILAAELESIHGDPADRFIAATAITHNAMLMTADERLLRWRHSVRRHNAET